MISYGDPSGPAPIIPWLYKKRPVRAFCFPQPNYAIKPCVVPENGLGILGALAGDRLFANIDLFMQYIKQYAFWLFFYLYVTECAYLKVDNPTCLVKVMTDGNNVCE